MLLSGMPIAALSCDENDSEETAQPKACAEVGGDLIIHRVLPRGIRLFVVLYGWIRR